ncbi:type III restriction-modification system endonuclease, partial [Neisseria gonorrhoeae]|nr:type III restriction-modification system endonuclease [Neisseria gonorrhoeae]
EKDFVKQLVGEINDNSFQEEISKKFTEELKQKILQKYPDIKPLVLVNQLFSDGIIDDNENFAEDGYDKLKAAYPEAFPKGLDKGKVSNAKDEGKDTIIMREGKYEELKALWELIHHKAVLQYKIKDEAEFVDLFTAYLRENAAKFPQAGICTAVNEAYINNGLMLSRRIDSIEDEDFIRFNTMTYREFLEKLAQTAKIQMQTLHQAFYRVRDELNIGDFLNMQTIAQIKNGFNRFLLHHSFHKFELDYRLVGSKIHPTKFTNKDGKPRAVKKADLGRFEDTEHRPAAGYLFGEIFYDSDIEHENVANNQIEGVIVFTKIPRNSIKIPVAGGGTYSPDFAYIVKTKSGEILNFVIEAKGTDGAEDLRKSEERKIKHAEKLFAEISKEIKVVFKTQFDGERIAELIGQNMPAGGHSENGH